MINGRWRFWENIENDINQKLSEIKKTSETMSKRRVNFA